MRTKKLEVKLVRRAATPVSEAGAKASASRVGGFFALGINASTPEAVTSRIRAAIDLGVLSNGEALPKESVLADMLGVTAFTLREALSRLRADGIVETRVGRGGGSFVRRGPVTATAGSAHSAIASLSSVALRDLGDWRTMLAGESAALASTRASPSNVARLSSIVNQIRSADVIVSKRAAGRFRLELAAAAQSVRLSAELIRFHEEHGDLFARPYDSLAFRNASADGLNAVVAALARHDVDHARAMAIDESRKLTDELLRERLHLVNPSELRTKGKDQLQLFADACWAPIGSVLVALDALASQSTEGLRAMQSDGTTASMSALVELSCATLGRLGSEVEGLGLMFNPGVMPGHPFGGPWVVRRGTQVAPSPHPSDPSQDDFYDYSMADWLLEPRASGEPVIVGPYVDYRGTNEYVLTVSAPVTIDGTFVAVAAADIPLAQFESTVAPALRTVEGRCCLLSAEGRVIVSNTADPGPGSILSDDRIRTHRPSGAMGWTVVTL